VPSSGAEYAYSLAAFGPIPAFLFAWTSTIVIKPAAVAIHCLTFSEYAIGPFLPMLELDGLDAEDANLKRAKMLLCSATISKFLMS